MRENGTASERPLDNVILKRMRGFAAMNKLKKEALKVIAAGMSQEEIAGLRTMFKVCMYTAAGLSANQSVASQHTPTAHTFVHSCNFFTYSPL